MAPAAELYRRDLLSYDGYNRLLAMPLLMFLVALLAAPRALTVPGRSVRTGLVTAAVGVGLLLAGNVVEFYGVLLQQRQNAYTASQIGKTEHWVGSDIGWIIFGIGMLTLLIAGLTTAEGMRRNRVRSIWIIAFTATLGVGVLAANLFALQSAVLSVPVLAAYAAGWIAFGVHLRRGSAAQGTWRVHPRPYRP